MSRSDGTDGDPRSLLIELILDPDADSEEAERFGRQLRAELAQLDVDAISPVVSAGVAQGAKGAGVDWGSLLDAIELGRASAQEREELISALVCSAPARE